MDCRINVETPELTARRVGGDAIVVSVDGSPIVLTDAEVRALQAQLAVALAAQVLRAA